MIDRPGYFTSIRAPSFRSRRESSSQRKLRASRCSVSAASWRKTDNSRRPTRRIIVIGGARVAPLFRLARQQSVDEAGGALPPGCLLRECPDARPGDGVVLRLAIVF